MTSPLSDIITQRTELIVLPLSDDVAKEICALIKEHTDIEVDKFKLEAWVKKKLFILVTDADTFDA